VEGKISENMLPMDSSQAPPFHQIDEYKFQCVCRDVLEMQKDDLIASCGIYGVRGQMQYGIDLIAPLRGPYANDVAQCKRYSDFKPSDIVKASDEFLQHLEYWKEFNLRRFILIVACPMDRLQQQEELQRQRRRFAEHGIEYEWWDARSLRQRLAPYPDIIRLYFPVPHEYWVELICGRQPEAISGMAQSVPSYAMMMNVVESQLEQLSAQFSEDVAEEIEAIRELYREGQTGEAHRLIGELQEGKKWGLLRAELRAKILRVAVGIELGHTSDVDRARSLLEQARGLDPEADYTAARTLVTYYEGGDDVEAALAEVATPRALDAFNLKIAVTIESGAPQDALQLVDSPPAGVTPDAETHRVHALALLGLKDLKGAREAITRAKELKPRWELVRTVEAIIDYFETISPAAHPAHYLVWPEAVGWSYLKRDDQSLAMLREAGEHFLRLAEKPSQNVEERRQFEIWHLACLANDPERQPQALEYCQSLLSEYPANHRALAWAANRNYGVDFAAGEAALEREIAVPLTDAGDERVEGIIILAGLYLREEKNAQAGRLLRRKQDDLKRVGLDDLVSLWWGQLYVAGGQVQKALDVARRATNPQVRRKVKFLALREQFRRTRKWKPLSRYLEKYYRKMRNGEDLFELCQLRASRGHWRFVAERADALVASVATPDAVRIAAISTANAGFPARCLDLLERGELFFPGGTLPNEMLLLKVHCQRRIGALSQALSDAEELVAREATPTNIIALMDVQLQKADLKGLAVTARRLVNREDFTARDVMRAAKLVLLEDVELAVKLWRQAKDRALEDPSLVGEAMGLGYTLGLDKEVGPLRARMHELAERGEGNVKSLSLREVVEQRERRVRRLSEIFADYTRGKLMLHLFAKEAHAPITDWLHGFPAQNRANVDLRHRPAVYARHGGNSIKRSVLAADGTVRMHMDVTALLVAAELGILDVVEETFRPIRISDSMTLALLQQLNILTPHQPAQLSVNRSIIEKVEGNKLQIIPEGAEMTAEADEQLRLALGEFWVGVAYQAKAESGYVVDHLPLRSHLDEDRVVELPAALQPHVINCRSVADALHSHGPLSDARHAEALGELGGEAVPVLETPPPPPKARLYLMGASASILADAGLLDFVCDHFQAFVISSAVQLARGGVQEHAHRLEMIGWLQRLVERVRDGIDNRVYEIIPVTEEREPNRLERGLPENYDLLTLNDMFHFVVAEGDVIWVDDRYVNGYGQRKGAPIVAVTDVLKKLLSDGKISAADYYEKLLQLRRSNIRYLPLDADEILFHLRQAQVTDGVAVETDELAALRRYVAACLLDGENLQKSPQPEGSANLFGEINFVFETTSGVIDAMAALWADETLDPEDAEARAEWLLNNLYTSRFGCRHLLPDAVAQRGDDLYLVGIDIAEPFAKGIGVGEREILAQILAEQDEAQPSEEGVREPSRRQRYFEWLKRRLVAPRVKADPGSMAGAAKVIRDLVRSNSEREFSGPQEYRHARMLMQRLYLDLPGELQEQIKQDPKLLAWIGIRVAEAVHINGIPFPPDEFWRAAETAANGGEATVEGYAGPGPFRLRGGSEPPPEAQGVSDQTEAGGLSQHVADNSAPEVAVNIYDQSGQFVSRFANPILGLMSADTSERLRALRANRHWFDVGQDAAEREMAEIAAIDDPRERVDRANSWAKRSAATYYLRLEEGMRVRNGFQRHELTGLDAAGLLRHYRLQPSYQTDADFTRVLSASTTSLLSDEGVEAAVDRMASLPVRIDDKIVEEINKLAPESKRAFLDGFRGRHPSPLGKLHFVDLTLRTAADDEVLPHARDVLEELFDEGVGAAQFKLFKSILVAVNEEFGYWSDISEWSPAVRLAMVWAHATNLYDAVHPIFISGDGDLEQLADWFTSPERQFSAELLHHDSAYRLDCAHPAKLRRVEFLSVSSLELLAGNDLAIIDRIGLLDLVRRTGFTETDGQFLPVQEMLGDNSLMANLTGSFLAGDKPALFLLVAGPEVSQFIAPENLETLVRLQFQELSTNAADARGWAVIASILRAQPLYRTLEDEFRALIGEVNFDQVLTEDRQAAMNALIVASMQSRVLTDTERSQCEGWLLKYIKAFSDRHSELLIEGDAEKAGDHAEELVNMMECAIRLSIRPDDPRASGLAFSGLNQRMFDTWGGLSDYLEPATLKSVFELPVRQLHGMWLVVLASRASRR
jgi:hypothetical protein